MSRITLKNVAAVEIGGHKSGRSFRVESDANGDPVQVFWRKRIADRSVEIVTTPVAVETPAVPAEDPAPTIAASAARPASPRASKKD